MINADISDCELLVRKIFITSKTDMGLKLSGSEIEPSLRRGVTVADFHDLGMIVVRSDKFKMLKVRE